VAEETHCPTVRPVCPHAMPCGTPRSCHRGPNRAFKPTGCAADSLVMWAAGGLTLRLNPAPDGDSGKTIGDSFLAATQPGRSRKKPKASVRQEVFELYDVVKATESELVLATNHSGSRSSSPAQELALHSFRANIWAAELYRIQSTFPETKGRPAHRRSDELICVSWKSVLRRCGERFQARSVARAEGMILSELAAWLRHSRGECERKPHTWGECRG